MRTLTTQQENIVAAALKKVAWLFEIDIDNDGDVDYYWSTEAKTWDEQDYVFKIIGFTPLHLSMGSPDQGIISPVRSTIRATFGGSEVGGVYASEFEGASVTIRLVCSTDADGEAEIMAWRLKVVSASSVDQVLTMECQDWFSRALEGDYPNTPLVSELFRADIMKNDNVCVPLAFGTPYFPLRWVLKNDYVSFIDADTFAIEGDKTGLFSSGQFLLARCGEDGVKSRHVSSSATDSGCVQVSKVTGDQIPGIGQTLTLEVGCTYRVFLYAKKGNVDATLIYLGATFSSYTAPADWADEPHTFDRVAASTAEDLMCYVYSAIDGKYVYFDSVVVRKVNPDGSYGPNLVSNSFFNDDVTGWSAINSANVAFQSGDGVVTTVVTLAASSAALTSNLVSVGTDHYLMGDAGVTYTIDKARSPREVNSKSVFESASYTFKQDTVTGSNGESYAVVQCLCDDEDRDGTNDANGMWAIAGKEVYDMPVRFSRSDLVSVRNPADIAKWLFIDFGIPEDEIDDDSRLAAAGEFTGRSFLLDVGLWCQISREKLITKLFALSGMVPVVRDKIGFKLLTKTSQMTITDDMVKPGSFSIIGTYTQKEKDSGYVTWQTEDEPVDEVNKTLVAVKSSTEKYSDTTIEAEWILDAVNAQKAGKLALQRMLLRDKTVNFTAKSQVLALEPGDMITINAQNLGTESSSYDCQVTRVSVQEGLWVDVEAVRFSDALDDWDDLTATGGVVIGESDTATAAKGVTPVYQGGVDASGVAGTASNAITKTVLIGSGGVLATNEDPASNGGFMATNTEMGCYNTDGDVRFKAVYGGDDQGDVTIGDYDGGQGIKWDQSGGKLTVLVNESGGVTVSGGGDVTLEGSDTDPGKLNFSGSSYGTELWCNTSGSAFSIRPDTDDVQLLYIGYQQPTLSRRFQDIKVFAERYIYLYAGGYNGGKELAYVMLGGGEDSPNFCRVRIDDLTDEDFQTYDFEYGCFFPGRDKFSDCGQATNAWDDVYADDFQNVADFFFLDHRKDENGQIVRVDDIETIKAIKPSGKFDQRTGLELIDDNTLPLWLRSKDKVTGDIAQDESGRPYISLKTIISLCMGAIRGLAGDVESLQEQVVSIGETIWSLRDQIESLGEQNTPDPPEQQITGTSLQEPIGHGLGGQRQGLDANEQDEQEAQSEQDDQMKVKDENHLKK